MIDPGTAIALGTLGIGGIVWLVRLEGRVNTHDSTAEEREKRNDDRHIENVNRLDRIETKVDTLLRNGNESDGQSRRRRGR